MLSNPVFCISRRASSTRPLLAGLALAVCVAAAPASAQSPTPIDAAASSTRLILLGTGAGPIPRRDRSQPANLLVVGGRPYLIDAGNGVARQLAFAGYATADVRTIFITHHHIDHNADIGALMSFTWIEDNKRNRADVPPVRFYGPPGTSELVAAAQSFLSVSERIFRAEVPMRPSAGLFEAHDFARDGEVYRDDRVVVTAAENTHYQFAPGSPSAGRDKSYALRFDTPGRSVVFTGDTGPSEALERLAGGADVLVSEVMDLDASMKAIESKAALPAPVAAAVRRHMAQEHLTPEQVGLLAQKAHVKLVVLTHFSPGLDGETDMSRYVDGVRKHYTGVVIAGRDLMEL
ncbi:MAG: MBL fold metallo-hydrolase [Burkholderiales bacterium]|nr:MBL fold metallo-hydrolase [Burkholderiales bacterium]